jgi:hypothetical protein
MKKPKNKKKNKTVWGVRCPECKKRMFSLFRHHYWTCGCPNDTMVDGGREYLRYGWAVGKVKPSRIKWTERLDGKYPSMGPDKSRWPY